MKKILLVLLVPTIALAGTNLKGHFEQILALSEALTEHIDKDKDGTMTTQSNVGQNILDCHLDAQEKFMKSIADVSRTQPDKSNYIKYTCNLETKGSLNMSTNRSNSDQITDTRRDYKTLFENFQSNQKLKFVSVNGGAVTPSTPATGVINKYEFSLETFTSDKKFEISASYDFVTAKCEIKEVTFKTVSYESLGQCQKHEQEKWPVPAVTDSNREQVQRLTAINETVDFVRSLNSDRKQVDCIVSPHGLSGERGAILSPVNCKLPTTDVVPSGEGEARPVRTRT